MYFLYSFMLAFWSVLLLPLFRFRAWRRGTDFPGIGQKLGRLPESLRFDGRRTIWFHSCSVGETLSLQPLVRALREQFPGARFLFSTTTPTGQAVARERFARYGNDGFFYFPIDLTPVVDRVLDWVRPSLVIIVETEIWPNLLRQTHSRGIPVVLANGRISNASFRYYRWLRPFLKRVLVQYHALMMQSEEDRARILSMGAPAERTGVTGNIKFDADIVEEKENASLMQELSSFLGVRDEDHNLIVAGSTHPDEEQILLDVLRRLRRISGLENTRLLLAPRHPERFEPVAQLVAKNGFALKRRSKETDIADGAAVLLLDTIGELPAVYRFASLVFIGGSLVNRGGHSIMEPALCSRAIVVGPSMDNFKTALEEFRIHESIFEITAPPEERDLQMKQLLETFRRLLLAPDERVVVGAAARSVLDRNRGAVQRTAGKIESIIDLEYT